jgi:hypothetical protein
MSMDRDLFLSIAALDAYNQGYNAGTKRDGTGLGTATFFRDSPEPDIGFYAIAYSWGLEKVISDRGTDNFGAHGDFTPNGSGSSDILTGWSIAFGFTAGTQAGALAKLAETEFKGKRPKAIVMSADGKPIAEFINPTEGSRS